MGATFVNGGSQILVDRLLAAGDFSGSATYTIRWGSGTVTDATGNVDLEAGIATGGVTATSESEDSADTAKWIGTLTATKDFTVSEAGLFVVGTGTASDMMIRGTHTGVALVATASDQIEYTFTLQFAG